VMTPRSSCLGGESTPLRGANLRLNYEINNVTEHTLGISWPPSKSCYGLTYRPTWVIFGKHRWASSGARRSLALWKIIPGSSRKPFRDRAKTARLPAGITVRLQPGILFAFAPERFSRSPRNRVRFPPESARSPVNVLDPIRGLRNPGHVNKRSGKW
jgi:hypothetical protein